MAQVRWSIVGVGIAGRARARAITEDPRAELVGVWRGRFADGVGAPVLASLDEAIAAADAVAICSPTPLHRAQVEAALRAGRHVVVEFPIAQGPADARALFDLADRLDRVLHVEHIELLEPAGRTLCGQVRPQLIQTIRVRFERAGPADGGPPALALHNVARLHRLCALAGPVATIDAVRSEPGRLEADLTMETGCRASLVFEQSPNLRRSTTIEVDTPTDRWKQVDGTLSRNGKDVSLLGVRSLFGRDHAHAMGTILDGTSPYVDRTRVLHVLEVVQRLGAERAGRVSTP
jgi:biliverdin reductase